MIETEEGEVPRISELDREPIVKEALPVVRVEEDMRELFDN
jgi:hypothetical protein